MTGGEGGGVPAGTRLNGIYEVENRIAVGGMGEVYAGHVIQTGDKVAIKMILPEHANNDVIVDLFRREASTLHNLYHEAIVRYFVFSVDPVLNRPYLAMEFVAGPSLGERLRDGGPLGEAEMAVLGRRVAGGLHAAHKLGIIHRDISPDNIILVGGNVEQAKIIDFGIARTTAAEGTLIGSGFAGKLNYVSPEQLGLEGGDVTGKSDIYSLGLVFAEAVIGQPLPMGGSQVEVIEKRRSVPDLATVPDWIRPLIARMIQPVPADRPDDMQAVAEALPDDAPAPGTPRAHPREQRRQRAAAAGKPGRRGRWLWLGAGGVGIAAAAVAGVLFLGGPGAGPDGAPGEGATAEGGAPSEGQDGTPTLVASETLAESDAPEAEEPEAEEPDVATAPPPTFSAPTESASTPATSGTDGSALAEPAPTPAPQVSDTLSGGLPPPGSGGSDALAPGFGQDAGQALATRPDEQPVLAPQGAVGAAPTVPESDEDPTANAAEPSIAAMVPGGLAEPELGAGSVEIAASGPAAGAVSAGESLAPSGEAPRPPTAAPAAEGPVVAGLPPPENQPPTVDSAPTEPITAVEGEPLDAVLGRFFDESGTADLRLEVEGDVPNGLGIRLAEGGVARLHGTPAEFGDYQLRLTAIDPEGQASRPITATVTIAPPTAERRVRSYILGYRGGNCFLSRPIALGPRSAQIEVFAAADNVQPVFAFNDAFIRDMGFEANIEMRPLTARQCPLIHALDEIGPQAIDNALVIHLARDTLAPGDVVAGRISGGAGAQLFLYDAAGDVTDLSQYVETTDGDTSFSLPITATGPQVLVAARARAGADTSDAAGLPALLEAAREGEASVALGFFVMK